MADEQHGKNPSARPAWKEPWCGIEDSKQKAAIEKELALEIGPEHPLWGTRPSAIGTRQDCDDVAVELSDGRFAIVHLVWHGKIDQFPREYPFALMLADLPTFQSEIDSDALEWSDEE